VNIQAHNEPPALQFTNHENYTPFSVNGAESSCIRELSSTTVIPNDPQKRHDRIFSGEGMKDQYQLYRYRWIVLAVFMFINLTIQILWIGYAPITGPAAKYYGVSDLQIGFLAMTFMIAFIPLSIPVSWVIDTYGFRLAVSIGAALMGVFGILRGLAGANYTLVLWNTIGIAVAQPFLLNAWTKVPAQWFAPSERATAGWRLSLRFCSCSLPGRTRPPRPALQGWKCAP
jgi:hypothetical protein